MALTQEISTLLPVEFRLLGGFDVLVHGEPLPPLPYRREQWLLALLVLRHTRDTSRDWLAATFWPDNEEGQALFYLRKSLSRLRKALGAEASRLLSPTPRTVRLNLDGAFADVVAFDTAIQKATWNEGAGKKENSSFLEKAVALYRGTLLPACQESWVITEREWREQAYQNALEMLATHAVEEGQPVAAVRWLRQLLVADPYRESAYCALMQALAACGDRAAMTQVYRDLRQLLYRDLNAEPAPETEALYKRLTQREVQAVSLPSASPPVGPPRRLPVPLSDLIGREQEIEEVVGWLNRCRLTTLAGAGGVGKTRLAIAAAEQGSGEFPDGVWFVDLAPLTDPALLTPTLLRTLDVKEETHSPSEETLEQTLASRTLLLVMDNCEHLLAVCASLMHRLLFACPGLRVLATSREALGLTGEHLYHVPSLALPPPEQVAAEKAASSLLEYSSVRLFVERARQTNASFHLTRNNAAIVAQICHRLDGIPLAIEMAAARVKSLSVAQVAVRLEDRFQLLTGGSRAALPRQRTLQAAIDWSHDLLSDKERILFWRLSVFAGGWTLEAAEAVCAGTGVEKGEILDALTRLVEKSLAVFEERREGAARYRFLETIRQYGAERLAESGELEALLHRHRNFFLQWAEEGEENNSAPQAHRLSLLEEDHDNLRMALTCCLNDPKGGEKGLRFGVALLGFWLLRGEVTEGRFWMKSLLSHPDAQGRTHSRANTLVGAGQLAWFQADYVTARVLYEDGLQMRRELGDRQGIARVLSSMGVLSYYQGDHVAARMLHEESLTIHRELGDRRAIAHTLGHVAGIAEARGDQVASNALLQESLTVLRELGDRPGIAHTLGNLGITVHEMGDYALARLLYEESLAIHRELGHRAGIAGVLKNTGSVACSLGDYASARSLYVESLGILQELGDRYNIAYLLELFAVLALKETRCDSAVSLWGAADALREAIGSPLIANDEAKQHCGLAAAREVLGEATFAAAWKHGRAMSLEQAVEYALA